MEELKDRIQSMNEELESSQKACEYYQNDMLPEIKKNTESLRVQMEAMSEMNKKLETENHGLKGSLGNKIKHYEQ